VNEVKNSGLRGRGGAGFSTGFEVVVRAQACAKPKYVLCNGDESEPGTCKDRLIFEHDPHAVIEGVMIAGWPWLEDRIHLRSRRVSLPSGNCAESDCRCLRSRISRQNIFGSGQGFDIFWHGGAGAYEVGEESR